MTIYYVGLESYESRYTLQLKNWNFSEFDANSISYVDVKGDMSLSNGNIKTGTVLDAHGRSYFACSQIMELVKYHAEGRIKKGDVIFFEDMFHPGISSLGYIFDQTSDKEKVPEIFVRCLAQTIDPDDFVWNENSKLHKWMRDYERMVFRIADGVLCASEEMIANIAISGMIDGSSKAKLYVTGLPFGMNEVKSRVKNIPDFKDKKNRVTFTSRWDDEKQPDFYMDVIQHYLSTNSWSNIEFSIFSGVDIMNKKNKYSKRLAEMTKKQEIIVYENLTKNQYYELLANTKVLFNCALQDWVSNTVSEADTFGCSLVFPAYRSFPEVFRSNENALYVPWSVEHAAEKIGDALNQPLHRSGSIAYMQNKTIMKSALIMTNQDNYRNLYLRDISNKNYRNFVR